MFLSIIMVGLTNLFWCTADETYQVRLVEGASNSSGHVQVFFNDMWVNVCARRFDVRSATVVCRQLGFSGRAAPLSVRSEEETPFYLSSVHCRGSELSLAECDLDWDTFCVHEFAGVTCQLGKVPVTACCL